MLYHLAEIHLSVDLERIIKTVYLDGVTHNLPQNLMPNQ
ncbi:hypothetical protein GXM_02246 [Nostoc sphaeroides CCNUC1]|uniref:Uncharacterized protein n=1 Tax=Nostoc sphaeroides CCNUC1 TaxID=2653204 RepID=A0A5P8VWQ0_9NOSO|nr:hypothetical protein GXM_02246 [Nostoc sphaeroides CCNUC1]